MYNLGMEEEEDFDVEENISELENEPPLGLYR